MAAYSDMKALAADASFIQRVTYALETYINTVATEAATAPNHEQRLAWATKSLQNIQGTAMNFLMPRVTQDPNIISSVSALAKGTPPDTIDAAITDAQIQTSVDSIANTDATKVVDYTNSFNTANDGNFRARIQAAVVAFIAQIMAEPITTTSHSSRAAWARQAVGNLSGVVNVIALPVVLDPLVNTVLYGVSDAYLQTAVQNQITTYLL